MSKDRTPRVSPVRDDPHALRWLVAFTARIREAASLTIGDVALDAVEALPELHTTRAELPPYQTHVCEAFAVALARLADDIRRGVYTDAPKAQP